MTQPLLAILADTYSDDPRIAIRSASAAGFNGLLFDPANPVIDLTALSASGVREFRHILSAAGVKLAGLRASLGPKGLTPGADLDRQLATIDKILRTAADLHADVVCLDTGPLPADNQPPPPRPAITPQQAGLILIPTLSATPPESTQLPSSPANTDLPFIAQVDSALAEIGNRADRYGIPLALHSELSGFASLIHALRSVDCPSFGVNLDPVAMLRDEWDMDQVFSAAGPSIRHLRAHDAILGDRHRTQPASIGTGAVNWPQLFSNLRHADYHGWITLDTAPLPNRPAAATAGRGYLLKLWRSL